jgi:hypothetical protein
MDMKQDPAFLNAELIDQILWFQSKTRTDERHDILKGMADIRRSCYGSCTMSMNFWHYVERYTGGTNVS